MIRVPLPASSDSDFEVFPVGSEYVGVAEIADSGDSMILYTTQIPWEESGTEPPLGDPRQRFTIARVGSGDWQDQTTLFTEVPIRAVGIEPSGASAIPSPPVLAPPRSPELGRARRNASERW